MGLVIGGLGGIGLLLAPALPGTAGFLVLLAFAFWLVSSGEPVPFEFAAPNPTLDQSAPPETQPDRIEDPLWASIPSGRFRMGSDENDSEKPVHEVAISAFQCLRTPVTRQLYLQIMGQDPGWPLGEADLRPVNRVSWFDAVKFCNRWSEVLALSPCYLCDGNNVRWDYQADGIRLLTEAEWEYACRAGSTGPSGVLAMTKHSCRSLLGLTKTQTINPNPLRLNGPMNLACLICTAMFGNGVGIGTALTMTRGRQTRLGRQRVVVVCCGAALSTSSPGSCARRAGAGSIPRSGTGTTVSAVRVAPAASVDKLTCCAFVIVLS
ncbi:MAG: hypothetical protein DM484_23065 [Candidatus Methylumidiphilus alinenensis]|uniref:Sulfatase-modifying factor enzyme-like domain-containing protein n=1 Tax=Candidatus Methylumidiphilus alinenensis TaxID=2202197 RepID=A0A2W4QPZ8_9GAMM|nr:MAG: hypothetical protein DM484_23065 [Candidatus Methylumidiphilus alinenensis]